MLSLYGCETKPFLDPFYDSVAADYIVTPERMHNQLDQGNSLILGVTVGSNDGKLQVGGNVNHWVVVDKVQPTGINDGQATGQVLLHNSLIGGQEIYSYDTLIRAASDFNSNPLTSRIVIPNQIKGMGIWVDLGTCP